MKHTGMVESLAGKIAVHRIPRIKFQQNVAVSYIEDYLEGEQPSPFFVKCESRSHEERKKTYFARRARKINLLDKMNTISRRA